AVEAHPKRPRLQADPGSAVSPTKYLERPGYQSRTRDRSRCSAWNPHSHLFVDKVRRIARAMSPSCSKEAVMQKQKISKVRLLIIAALLYPACALAQIGGGNSGS